VNQLGSRPKGWAECRLGELIKIVRGISYTKEQASVMDGPGLVPIVRATNIDQQLDFEGLVYIPTSCVSTEQYLCKGDIVIAASSGSKSVVGKAAQLRQAWHGSFGAFCMGIRPSPLIDAAYLSWFLQTEEYRRQVSDLASGTSINNLRREHIEGLRFRLAPLEEQRGIVSKLEELLSELDAGVAALERVRAGLKRYRAAVLKAAVEGKLTEEWRTQHPDTEPASVLLERILKERRYNWEQAQLAKAAKAGARPPTGWQVKYQEPDALRLQPEVRLPIGWTWATWEQLSMRVTVGHVGPMKHEYIKAGVPFLRSQNIRENRFSKEGLLFVSQQFHRQLSKSVVHPGDLAVVRSGSVGVTCVIPDWLGEANCSDLVLIQKPIGLLADFGGYYMNSTAQRLIRDGSVGIALTHFNTRSVANLAVPLPPLEEQRQIVIEVERRVSILYEIEAQVEANLKRAARLRQGILKQAFEGKLVPQDPNDEPAEQLLARIRQQRQAASTSGDGKPAARRRGRPGKSNATLPLFREDDGDDTGGEP